MGLLHQEYAHCRGQPRQWISRVRPGTTRIAAQSAVAAAALALAAAAFAQPAAALALGTPAVGAVHIQRSVYV